MLTKLALRPGIQKENTRFYNNAGWYDSDKIRFRAGTPESIGGWIPIANAATFQGVCRSLFDWLTLGGAKIMAVGTNLKYYLEVGGIYYDITPLRETTAAGDVTFAAVDGSDVITVTDVAHGAVIGDFVTFSDAVSLGGNITAAVLNREYQIVSVVDADNYTIEATATANASDIGDGGAAVVGAYQINVGPEIQVPLVGWGAGAWGLGTWGVGVTSPIALRLWSQSNFGEDLIFGPRTGPMYYWNVSSGVTSRAVALSSLGGASDVPVIQNTIFVSDVSRFVFAFGANEIGSSTLDPMLIRWSDQEDAANWTPAVTNQAGSIRLSKGTRILTALQSRQEILAFTDGALYSLQYLGAPIVWGAQLVGDGVTCMAPNVVSTAANVTYWMGIDKFYVFDGNASTLNCDVRRYVFSDMNLLQREQFFAGSIEEFNEVWWFYCSANSMAIDRYVVYNYLEKIWYTGNLGRTAWLDVCNCSFPNAATYDYTIVQHENGVDDNTNGTPQPLHSYIESSEWGTGDGDSFTFIRRALPDVTFRGSTEGTTPQLTMTVKPMTNSGSGYNSPESEGGSPSAPVVRIAQAPIEEFTGQVFIRVRGRQFVLRYEANQLGTAWQTGALRVDAAKDGRR